MSQSGGGCVEIRFRRAQIGWELDYWIKSSYVRKKRVSKFGTEEETANVSRLTYIDHGKLNDVRARRKYQRFSPPVT